MDRHDEEPTAGQEETSPAPVRASTFSELVEHALQLADPLEKAWSEALDEVVLDEAHEQFVAKWSAVFTELTEELQRSDAALEEAGYDPRLHKPFLGKQTVDALAEPADAEGRWRRLHLAHVLAVEPLAKAIGAVTEPSKNQVNLITQERRQWWEAGAFALVRARARLLLRLGRRLAVAEATLLAQRDSASTSVEFQDEAFDRLLLAGQAKSLGDPEACLMHVHHSLLALLRLTDADAAADSVGQRLAELDSLSDYRKPLEVLDRLVDPRADIHGDIAIAALVAELLLPLARDLVLHPPPELIEHGAGR